MNHDLTKLAHEMRQCHERGKSWCLPAMTARELGILARLLDGLAVQTPVSALLH